MLIVHRPQHSTSSNTTTVLGGVILIEMRKSWLLVFWQGNPNSPAGRPQRRQSRIRPLCQAAWCSTSAARGTATLLAGRRQRRSCRWSVASPPCLLY